MITGPREWEGVDDDLVARPGVADGHDTNHTYAAEPATTTSATSTRFIGRTLIVACNDEAAPRKLTPDVQFVAGAIRSFGSSGRRG